MNFLVTAAGAVASAAALPSSSLAAPPTSSDAIEVEVAAPTYEPPTRMAELRSMEFDFGPFPEYPPEIFGKLPAGFILEQQCIETLCFWHRKAIKVLDRPIDDEWERDAYCMVKNRILGAILAARPATPGQVAAQLRAAVAEIECLSTEECKASIEEVLDVYDFVKISADLTAATALLDPKKRVGALQRGRKLTRAGLLTRYQSFLVQELETVSWNLYGVRDYAKQFVIFDDAVRARCRSTDRCYSFFDERTLPDRARAVLESLKIDTETADVIA